MYFVVVVVVAAVVVGFFPAFLSRFSTSTPTHHVLHSTLRNKPRYG